VWKKIIKFSEFHGQMAVEYMLKEGETMKTLIWVSLIEISMLKREAIHGFFWNIWFRSSSSKKMTNLKWGFDQMDLEESSEHIFISIRHFPSSESVAQHQVLPSYQAPNIVNIRGLQYGPARKSCRNYFDDMRRKRVRST